MRENAPKAPRRGFTLMELMIVITIIGILVSFVLVASYQGVERARERATQALITKIDQGLSDRLGALLTQSVDPNGAHQYLAAIIPPNVSSPNPAAIWGVPGDQRAQVISTLDYLKAEMPDVFVYDPTLPDPWYPLNFAGLAYPLSRVGDAPSPTTRNEFLLPLGYMTTPGYSPGSFDASGNPQNGPGANITDPTTGTFLNPTPSGSTGIYGASYSARGSVMKVLKVPDPTSTTGAILSIPSRAWDGADNDGNGYIDELTPQETGMPQAQINAILTTLGKHKHNTARSECLYALLVGGVGPLGSTFSPDDFGPNEVADTDGDGLPELVDGWGKPLQFYRWPTHYISGLQHGYGPYSLTNTAEARETSQLDPNNTLVAPAWWSQTFNGNGPTMALPSTSAVTVMGYFVNLADWQYPFKTGSGPFYSLWDRSGMFARRAYFCRPLVVSGGLDGKLGVAQLGFDYTNYGCSIAGNVPITPANVIQIENSASSLSPVRNAFSAANPYPSEATPGDPIALGMQTDWGQDDISNQNLQTSNGGVK